MSPSLETPAPRRPRRLGRTIMLTLLALFILPVLGRAPLYFHDRGPADYRRADWSSIGSLPQASAAPEARVLFLSGQTGGLKGSVSVHSWIVYKAENATAWKRYDVVGWGEPGRTNLRDPDGRWYGNAPHVIADVKGAQAQALIPKIEAAIKDYRYANAGDYRLWPGPNSNTFVATVLRAVPEIGVAMPPNAVGRDFRPLPYAGLTD